MTSPHLWVRAEQRDNEARVGLMPEGAAQLVKDGFTVTVEMSENRVVPIAPYAEAGCKIAPMASWVDAPDNAIIFGLKELPEDGSPLRHRHIMFGHAYKGQSAGRILLDRFVAGGGTLLDLEYLVDDARRRVAAFGYWAGFAGAAVSLKCWAAQQRGEICGPVSPYENADVMKTELLTELNAVSDLRPSALIIGALGRVGTGARDLSEAMGVTVTGWDMAETAHGGPFPEILQHDLFLNCILAGADTPAFVRPDAPEAVRNLTVIGDIACDPDGDYNPVQVYDRATTWSEPALRVHDAPPLDVMAIDNLPSMLPLESSQDYASQLLPTLRGLAGDPNGVWTRVTATFDAQK
tara:strand:- start:2509 stop:3561 length:1053 start_codon:yes stop_codon:yes gene_type:complete